MKLLLYAEETNRAGLRLQRMLEIFEMGIDIKVYRTIDSLAHGLLQPDISYDGTIAVLLAHSKKELQSLLSIRDLITDVRVIMVLPDREDDTIKKGFLLYPRLVTYVDGDFVLIAAVLKKMIARINSNKKHVGFFEESGGCSDDMQTST
ncbi:hypothetical protein ACFL03_01430 [Thermodesulfobacteriota bacterium]